MKEQIRKIPLRVKKVDTLELGVGAVLVLVSFLMPIIFNMHSFPVRQYLFQALHQSEKTFLMTAASRTMSVRFSSVSRSVLPGEARKRRCSTLR